ncbi:MAG TPA: FtsQ-type POTRA domain-containing protein [Terriglobales bacterium]|nr:FtsQ-type POTRA domain-containing protein [Terriglobales bacterium]
MVRNNGPLYPGDEPSPRAGTPAASQVADPEPDFRLNDLDVEEESPFLRAQKRVPVRRGALRGKNAGYLRITIVLAAVLAATTLVAMITYQYSSHSWRFRLESSDRIEITGTQHITRKQVMEVLGGDIGRNVFFIPLEERKKQLEEIPWVESAAIMRLLPDRLKVEIKERTPVAFVQVGSRMALIDSYGVVMDLPAGGARKYSFPVLVGMTPSEPLSTCAARMKIYAELVRQLDEGGARYSQDLSDVDLIDPEDVKVTVSDPAGNVQVHLGGANFAERFRLYKAHVQEWRQQFSRLDSVDLRYDGQVIVNPDAPEARKQVPIQPAPAKVRPANLHPGGKKASARHVR